VTLATSREPLRDGHGRLIGDLRLSVTDRCNLRCQYCMPAAGLPWLERSDLLTFQEMERLVALVASMGVRDVRLTGGEPLVRRDLHVLVRMLAPLVDDLAITTNGYLLERDAASLVAAGVGRFNVSLDSVQRDRFFAMTRRDVLPQVLRGLGALAELVPTTSIKVNAVAMRGFTEDEALLLAELARERGYEVRFIEYMPLDAQDDWSAEGVVAGAEILERISEAYELVADTDDQPEPSTPFRFADGAPGRVGIIPSVTQPFCDSCNRLRLTADGALRACLFALEETDLRAPLRSDASDDELAKLARDCVRAKWAGHRIGQPDFEKPARSMSMIGG
jgi:cyclic pyranopterin phosphate synthase